MQTQTPQLAVVIKGYYDTKDNEAFGIYLLDTKSVYIIPCEKDILNEQKKSEFYQAMEQEEGVITSGSSDSRDDLLTRLRDKGI